MNNIYTNTCMILQTFVYLHNNKAQQTAKERIETKKKVKKSKK